MTATKPKRSPLVKKPKKTKKPTRPTKPRTTISARELKDALQRVETGVHEIRRHVKRMKDNKRIPYKAKRQVWKMLYSAGSDSVEGPLPGTTPPPRPQDPLCRPEMTKPDTNSGAGTPLPAMFLPLPSPKNVTAGEIYQWLQALQNWLEACSTATGALDPKYVIHKGRR